ncbi:MAG TPA: PA14 domain-containing protein [Geminicoccaceae bacterium]|nr:PA14 domain-containing protein [Geminicoccaceae bacterium]
MTSRQPWTSILGVAVLGAVLLLAAGGARAQGVSPAEPQPDPAELKPGLAVCYMYEFVRHIDQMVGYEGSLTCEPGTPLLELNATGGQGKVLGSKHNDGVMAKITGLIHLEKPGTYTFGFESNDGVRLEIGGQMVLEDPGVHADEFSDLGTIEVSEPGWYPLTIRYYERKNTWTIRFYWLPPGGEPGSLPLVPPEVLAHLEAPPA